MRQSSGFSTVFRWLIISGFLLLNGLLFAQISGVTSAPAGLYPSEKVNLALRRTVDHLRRAAGDSQSRIPMVEQPDAQTFRIQLGHTFAYDSLPDVLQASFERHNITGAYDVALLNCTTGTIQLGYSLTDLRGDQIPCQGRAQPAGCYVLQVTFAAVAPPAQRIPDWSVFAIGGLLTSLLVVVWRRKVRIEPAHKPTPVPTSTTASLQFGRSSLNVANQLLTANTSQHNLTYRETKLLCLLVNHPNQVLERDLILKLVWEDEGVTVGRSVDVFISRLRKLLQSDPGLRIAAVHGVGYRLDVQNTTHPV